MRKLLPVALAVALVAVTFLGGCDWSDLFDSWPRRYPGRYYEIGENAVLARDGGFYVTGSRFLDHRTCEAYCIRTDASGDLVWANSYREDDSTYTYGSAAVGLGDGGLLIAGEVYWRDTTSHTEVLLVRCDADGRALWTRRVAIERASYVKGLARTPDGGHILVGYTMSPRGQFWAYALRIDSAGDELWRRVFPELYWATGVAVCPDGTYRLACNRSLYDAAVLALGGGGESLWVRDLGTSQQAAQVQSVAATPDGGVVVVGYAQATVQSDMEGYLARLDVGGQLLWEKSYSHGLDDDATSVAYLADGGFVIAGWTGRKATLDDPGTRELYVAKCDSLGTFSWERTFGAPAQTVARSVVVTEDGCAAAAGSIDGTGGDTDFYLVKVRL